MRKVLFCMFVIMFITSCSKEGRTFFATDKLEINLPNGEKLVNANISDEQTTVSYLTEPMDSLYKPKVKKLTVNRLNSGLKRQITFIESK